MYAPQGFPAVFSVLSFHVVAALLGFLAWWLTTPPFCLGIIFPEQFQDTLFFRRSFPFGILLFCYLPLPCGEIVVVLLHKSGGFIIQLPECLHIRIALVLYEIGYPFQSFVDLLLDILNLLGKGLTLFAFE